MNMRTSRKSGFTLVELMVVVFIIGLTAALTLPNFVRANSVSQKNACISNLYQIQGAIHQWGVETKAPPGTLSNSVTSVPICAIRWLPGGRHQFRQQLHH